MLGFEALRRAAELLTPASLRVVAGGPRYQTFISDVGADCPGGEVEVTLAPLAALRVAPRAALSFRYQGEDLWATGRLVEAARGQGRLLLRRPPTVRAPRPARIAIDSATVVATFVAENTGLGRSFAPVVDISRHALRLESSVPLAAGTRLRGVVLTRRNQVLRRAEGTVLNCGAVHRPDGAVFYECGVRLYPSRAVERDDPADTVEIRDYDRVCAILWALCDLAYEVTLRVGTTRARGRLLPGEGPRDRVPALTCAVDEPLPLDGGAVQVECALFGSGYRFLARAQRHDAGTLALWPAPAMRETHRRDEERIVLSPHLEARVTFRHPLEREAQSCRLSDMSGAGFGFVPDATRGALWPDLPLHDVVLELPGARLCPSVAHVRISEEQRCGVEMSGLGEHEAEQLRIALLQLSGQPARLHDGVDLGGINAFHRRVHLLDADMERNLAVRLDETARTWRLAHQHPAGLMRTTTGSWKGEVGSTANVVRAYDSGWILQHTAVASAAVPASPGMMYTFLLSLITPRDDCEYLASFATDEFKSFHANWATFAQAFSTPHFRGATPFHLYAADARAPGTAPSEGVRRIGEPEEAVVEHAAARALDPVCVRALGLVRGEITLAETRRAFAQAGLERGREAWGSFASGRCHGVLLREWASPGLSLSSLLSAGMLLPGVAGDESDAGLAALCALAAEAEEPAAPVRFLFVPKAMTQAPVEAAGFRRVGGCVLYACHRVGLREFLRFFAARYGFLQARMSVRRSVAA